ncbi:MAG: DUF3991 and toprim domain-containing protein [Oscillospiraceae bacterium]|jgi:hypothetical protein|nr:DUF3991 and toprim domain-containing protein [Oscillospiraceae bacterium]
MKLDEKIVERVRNADIIAFLERRGFTFTERGDAFRCKEHSSLAVKADRLSWYWHSKGIGGHGALDFLMKAENMPFREAVEAVTGMKPATAPPRRETEQPKTLVLPEKKGIPLLLYDYLCKKRGIDGEIVNTLIQKETLYEDRRGNVVFVGHDERGKARFASLRGTYGDCRFRMDCAGSDKRYGFNMAACGASDRLYIFESPIDAMSHASLVNAATGDTDAWKQHSRLSLAGTSDTALPFFLNQHTVVKELVFCLDNDEPGREAAAVMARKYAEKGYQTRLELPAGKDFNEDLTALISERTRQKHTKPLHRDVDI